MSASAATDGAPSGQQRPKGRFAETLSHARHIIGENPVTGLSFALFALLLLCAVFGPLLSPYDPLASDTVAALNRAHAAASFTYISTAGGAFLEWMEGKVLPGVAALEK